MAFISILLIWALLANSNNSMEQFLFDYQNRYQILFIGGI